MSNARIVTLSDCTVEESNRTEDTLLVVTTPAGAVFEVTDPHPVFARVKAEKAVRDIAEVML